MDLKVLKDDSRSFFDILPQDWRNAIEWIWDDYKNEADIYVFREGEEIVAGGVIFKGIPPNMTYFEIQNGKRYIENGYHYIGFLFVVPCRRNEALGSKWLKAVKSRFPSQSYWLTIEEEDLAPFYAKNGFECVAASQDMDLPEWLFVFVPNT